VEREIDDIAIEFVNGNKTVFGGFYRLHDPSLWSKEYL
jgi:hypothetical protein